ncbi:MAG TPA: GxxExxY protein [Chitinophagales bacterium]|nr:GxxExxY protein [Chitinophagales bacterium]HMZ88522.1 GxxExxY protein [Chitinophagales bacterium]
MKPNEVSRIIIEEAIYIHRKIGPGLLESVYEKMLAHRLIKRGLIVKTQVPVPVVMDEVQLEIGFRADMIVENCIVVEIKSLDLVPKVAFMQLKTYLRFTNIQLGLLINFNVPLLKDGVTRFVLDFKEE